MRTTFLLRDGLSQLVLHPENKLERTLLDLLHDGGLSVDAHRAQFAETQGGYVRQFGLGGHSFVGSDHLPDTVLVMRPAEDVPDDLVRLPAEADLCKLTDGTWVYKNHAGTWQHCPSPTQTQDRGPTFPPDDVHAYFRRRPLDGSWEAHDRRLGDWYPTTGLPELDPEYRVGHLEETLRLIRDQYVVNRGDLSDQVSLEVIAKICTETLGDGK